MIKFITITAFSFLLSTIVFASDDSVLVEAHDTHTVIDEKQYDLAFWEAIDSHFKDDIPPLKIIEGDISFENYSSILIEAQKRDIRIGLITKPLTE